MSLGTGRHVLTHLPRPFFASSRATNQLQDPVERAITRQKLPCLVANWQIFPRLEAVPKSLPIGWLGSPAHRQSQIDKTISPPLCLCRRKRTGQLATIPLSLGATPAWRRSVAVSGDWPADPRCGPMDLFSDRRLRERSNGSGIPRASHLESASFTHIRLQPTTTLSHESFLWEDAEGMKFFRPCAPIPLLPANRNGLNAASTVRIPASRTVACSLTRSLGPEDRHRNFRWRRPAEGKDLRFSYSALGAQPQLEQCRPLGAAVANPHGAAWHAIDPRRRMAACAAKESSQRIPGPLSRLRDWRWRQPEEGVGRFSSFSPSGPRGPNKRNAAPPRLGLQRTDF